MSVAGSATAVRSWSAALGLGVVVTVVLVLGFFYAPHWLLVKLASPSRAARAIVAALWTGVALALAGWWAWRWTAPRGARR